MAEQIVTPDVIRALTSEEGFSREASDQAMEWVLDPPKKISWYRFLSWALTFMGAGLMLAGVIFFFAFNWEAMGRFAKFGLVEILVCGAVAVAWKFEDRIPGQAGLIGAAVLVGPLLAVYGQTYQTGADAFELFVGWSLMILPWVLMSRSAALWLIWMGIVETGFILAWEQVLGDRLDTDGPIPPLLILFSINAVFWALKELLASRGVSWLQAKWPVRIVATLTLFTIVPSITLIIVGESASSTGLNFLTILLGASLVVSALYYYRLRRPDLFMLTITLASTMCVATVLLGQFLLGELDAELIGFFVMGFAVIAQVAFITWWIRKESGRIKTASEQDMDEVSE